MAKDISPNLPRPVRDIMRICERAGYKLRTEVVETMGLSEMLLRITVPEHLIDVDVNEDSDSHHERLDHQIEVFAWLQEQCYSDMLGTMINAWLVSKRETIKGAGGTPYGRS